MKLNFTHIASLMLMTAAVALCGVMDANGQGFVDTFDAAPTNGATRALSIDNSGSAVPGQFPSSAFDVFGIVDRNVTGDFGDDSVLDAEDTFGLVKPEKTDLFLGFSDTNNGDNPTGDVSVTWTVSTAGQTDLELSFDIAAMGDFETSDLLRFTASFDGGAATTVIENSNVTTPAGEVFTYTLDNGSLAIPFNASADDPIEVQTDIQDPFAFGTNLVVNEFQTITAPIVGSGSVLTLTLEYNTNGAPEVMAIDNVQVAAASTGTCGDVNLDGSIDFLDITPFIALLSSGGFQAEADCDPNGVVNFLDIAPFIIVLSGG